MPVSLRQRVVGMRVGRRLSLKSIGFGFAGRLAAAQPHIDELARPTPAAMPVEAAAAQDRGFERELRRQAGAHLLLGRRRAGLVVEDGVARRRRGARCGRRAPVSVNTRSPSGISMLAANLGVRRAASSARRSRLPAGEPARDAQEARPPERLRLRDNPPAARNACSPSAISARVRIGRQRVGECLGEIADRVVDHGAAVGGAGRRVDGVERAQLEDVLGVDRVGIAQPVLDLGDDELRRPRRERRLRLAAAATGLHACGGASSVARPARDSARRARAPRSSAPRPRPRRAAARSARRPSARRRAWRRGSGSPPARRAPARSRAPKGRCAAPADRGRAACRIGRLSQGSLRVSGGQTPSTSPPSTTRSTIAGALRAGRRCARARPALAAGARSRSAMRGVEQLGIVAGRDGELRRPACRRSRRTRAPALRRRCRRRPRCAVGVARQARRSRRDGARPASAKRLRAGCSASSGASAVAERVDQRRARRRARRRSTSRARIGAMQRRRALGRGRSRAHAPSPALPGFGRGPRSTARSSAATARDARLRRAEPQQRMLEQREQRHRRKPAERGFARPAARTRRPACRRAHRRRNRRPARSSAPAPPARGAPARGRASPARRSCPASRTASRSATAMASASSSALAASITRHVGERRVGSGAKSLSSSRSCQQLGGGGRAAALPRRALAAVRRGAPSASTCVARDADAREQRLHGELRMAEARRRRARRLPAISLPGRLVEIGVEAGQHQGAVRQLGDGGEQLGGRRHRAGRAGGDHRRRRAAASRCGLGLDQPVAPLGRLDRAAFVQDRAASRRARSCRKSQRQLPVFVELVRHQVVEPVPATCRVVMSSISRARSSASASAAAGVLATSGAPLAPRMLGDAAHFRISCASSSRRSRPPSASGSVERRLGQLAGRGFGEGDLVLVDVADRHDARQDRGVAVERVEEHVARQPAGAPRRQIERGARERERIAASPESRAPARPRSSASISVGRNGAEAGMVKTLALDWPACA